jgi:ACT domain-containing protein
MANEEIIYKITRAVFRNLGDGANEREVEQLVTDIYREIEPTLSQGSSISDNQSSSKQLGSSQRLIVSVFGLDHPGIVAGVAQVLAEADCSIIDINQTVVQGKFAMVIIADTSRAKDSAAVLKERFKNQGQKLGVHIYAQREDLFNAMHRI